MLPLHLQSPAVLQLRLHAPHTQQVPEHNVVPAGRETGGEDAHRLYKKTPKQTTEQILRREEEHTLLQDSRGEEDVQRPLDLVGEAEGRPACGRDLTRGGVLWRSGSISGAGRLWKIKQA